LPWLPGDGLTVANSVLDLVRFDRFAVRRRIKQIDNFVRLPIRMQDTSDTKKPFVKAGPALRHRGQEITSEAREIGFYHKRNCAGRTGFGIVDSMGPVLCQKWQIGQG
jgi:hypothetical protein